MSKSNKSTKTTTTPSSPAEWVHVDDLEPWVRNPRSNDHKVPEIVGKLLRFGWGSPIVAWRDAPSLQYPHPNNVMQPAGHRIGAGHLRRKGMLYLMQHSPDEVLAMLANAGVPTSHEMIVSLKASWTKDKGYKLSDAPAPGMVPVRFVQFASEREYEAFALMDNTRGGDWDDDEMALLIAEHQRNYDENFASLGFDDQFINDMSARGNAALDALLTDDGGSDLADLLSGSGIGDVPETPTNTTSTVTNNTQNVTKTSGEGDGHVQPTGGEKQQSLPHIRFGPHRMFMSEEDGALLQQKLDAYAKQFGSLHGFAGIIIRSIPTIG